MTMPRVSALFKYWEEWPPVHVATRIAWLTMDKAPIASSNASKDGGNVYEFMGMPGVSSTWAGGPPVRAQDVVELAERVGKKNG